MKISNKKYQALKSAAKKRGGKMAAGGVKAGAVQVLAGAITAWGNQKLSESSAFYRSQWFIGPAAIGVVGFLLKRKDKFAAVGNAMLGASGFALAQNYMFTSANRAAAGDAQGVYGDVGAIYGGAAAPALNATHATSSNAATSAYDVSAALNL